MREKPKITEHHKRLFSLFQKAIEEERAAQKLYADIQALCEDPELKGVLERFRVDEEGHEQELMKRYAEYRARFAAEDV